MRAAPVLPIARRERRAALKFGIPCIVAVALLALYQAASSRWAVSDAIASGGGEPVIRGMASPPIAIPRGESAITPEDATLLKGPIRALFLIQPPGIVPHMPRRFTRYFSNTASNKQQQEEGPNSVRVSQEDIARAKDSVVQQLPHISDPNVVTAQIYNALKDFIVDVPDDAHPYYVDYGGSIGSHLAENHGNATVVVIEAPGRAVPASLADNLYRVVTASLSAPQFVHWYVACNFASAAFILQRAVAGRYLGEWEAGNAVPHILRALPTSRAVFAALLPSEVQDLENIAGSAGVFDLAARPQVEFQGAVERLHVKVRRLVVLFVDGGVASGDVLNDDSGAVVLVEVKVLESSRACAKTWGAPLVQWGRRIFAHIREEGKLMSFQVRSEKAKDSAGLGRTIHPLQYIPSINLDTLLGAGLSESARLRLLSMMIRTPRYSDPLPHNWIVGLGGRALRIDKVDERYDREVDEMKGYWGNSTRGYFHLIGHHLCLPIAPAGVPAALESADMITACVQECKACWSCCSYLPKGSEPCQRCMKCGDCVTTSARASANLGASVSCQQSYTSMHQARRVWAAWKRADHRYDAKRGAATPNC